jgi:hypothetical protein
MRTAVRRLPSAGVFLRRRLGVEQLPARLAPRLSVIMIIACVSSDARTR